MSSKFMNFIDKANKVIFFIGAITLFTLFSIIMFREIFRSSYTPPTVEIIKDNSTNQDITFSKRYFTRINDLFVFEISAKKLSSDNGDAFYMFGGSAKYDASGLQSNTINLLFTAENGSSRLLLDKPMLITEVTIQRKDKSRDRYAVSKNLYTFAPKDSNKDNYLDHKDNEDFWVSNADGTNLKKVISNIDDYRVIEDDTVLIKKAEEFYLYYVDKDQLVQLDTTIKKP